MTDPLRAGSPVDPEADESTAFPREFCGCCGLGPSCGSFDDWWPAFGFGLSTAVLVGDWNDHPIFGVGYATWQPYAGRVGIGGSAPPVVEGPYELRVLRPGPHHKDTSLLVLVVSDVEEFGRRIEAGIKSRSAAVRFSRDFGPRDVRHARRSLRALRSSGFSSEDLFGIARFVTSLGVDGQLPPAYFSAAAADYRRLMPRPRSGHHWFSEDPRLPHVLPPERPPLLPPRPYRGPNPRFPRTREEWRALEQLVERTHFDLSQIVTAVADLTEPARRFGPRANDAFRLVEEIRSAFEDASYIAPWHGEHGDPGSSPGRTPFEGRVDRFRHESKDAESDPIASSAARRIYNREGKP